MEKDTHITEVVFRKFRNGDIIALFPHVIEGLDGSVSSYMHVGQHGAADYHHLVRSTALATEEEYSDLKAELENNFGYCLKVIKRYNHDKYLSALKEYLKLACP